VPITSAAAPRSASTASSASRRATSTAARPDAVLELLAVNFEATRGPDDPGGAVTLVFAGGGAVQLTVEVIEVRLADLGAAWATRGQARS